MAPSRLLVSIELLVIVIVSASLIQIFIRNASRPSDPSFDMLHIIAKG